MTNASFGTKIAAPYAKGLLYKTKEQKDYTAF